MLRLKPDRQGRLYAWTLNTNLHEIRGHEEAFKRRGEPDSTRDFGAENWIDRLARQRAFADRDPAVLVVGGGQAGLCIAARLQQLGVDTLIVDRHARVGDNWRKRYHSLTLHNEVYVNHLPYMPFPPTWPVYIPKDMLANWFEAYVDALELNFWTGTELIVGSYDDALKQWSVTLRRADGSERVMHPRHLIFATGVSSIPYTPDLPGLDDFAGTKVHSGAFADAEHWRGRKALVLGTGTSGHDVAQELQAHGADVTIIQRSKTYVVSLKEAQSVYAIYSEGIPFDDCDLLATSFPYPVLQRSYQVSTARGLEVDKALLDALDKRGFRLWAGEDETGFQMMYLRRGGGYYFNVGCSELIISGKIKLLQFSDIERFVAAGRAAAKTAHWCRPTSWCSRPATRASRKPCGFISAMPLPTKSARSGASTTAASCATCGGGPRSRASGSPPASSRNAVSFRAISRCRSRRSKKGCWARFSVVRMTLPRRRFLHLAAGTVALPAVTRLARADTYPSRPVHIVIGFPPGQSADISARLLGQWLSERLGQTFVIDNKPGASSSVATEFVVRAPPDGYTLLWVVTSNYINATLYKKLPYNFISDIAPVASNTRTPLVMEVTPSLPVNTVAEFIAYAKVHPGKLNMASGGIGNSTHMAGELFKMMTGIEMLHVPYRGSAPALTDLLSGQVQVMFDLMASSIGHVRAGKLRPLAVTTAARSQALPDVPTVGEFVPGYEASAVGGIGAPKGTPAEIVFRLNAEINAALAELGNERPLRRFGRDPGARLAGRVRPVDRRGNRQVGQGDQVLRHQAAVRLHAVEAEQSSWCIAEQFAPLGRVGKQQPGKFH